MWPAQPNQIQMRSLILPILVSILFSPALVDAQGFFLRVGGGYALGASGDDSGSQLVIRDLGNRETVIFSSLGQGALFGLAVGYLFNENIGLQVGAEYLAGVSHTTSSIEATSLLESTSSSKGSQFRLLPAVIVRGGLGSLDPYARIGLCLPLSSTTQNQISTTETDAVTGTTVETRYEEEIKGALNLGFTGAFGVNYAVSSQLALFAEVGGISQRTHGESGQVTRWESDGTNLLDQANTFTTQWNYQDELTPESNSTVTGTDLNPDMPEDRIQITQNFNSFFFKVGVTILLGGASFD